MSDEATIEQRVAAGAAWLDKEQPGWERRVDAARLNLASCSECVLGQVFAEAAAAERSSVDGFSLASGMYGEADFGALGFDFEVGHADEADDLDAAWLSLIKSRFDTGELSDAQ